MSGNDIGTITVAGAMEGARTERSVRHGL